MGDFCAELTRWPLEALHILRTGRFRRLSFQIRGVTGKDTQWFQFKNRQQMELWRESLAARMPEALQSGAAVLEPQSPAESPGPHLESASSADCSDPRIEPVVLLKSRPGTRFQLLGMVESKAPKRQSAAAGLAIRAAMMGADAVVDLNRERLPGFFKTEHRASGMAVRAVDDEGRLELKTRWFSSQIGQIAIVMLVLAGLELFGDIFGLFALAGLGLTPTMLEWLVAALNLTGGLSITGLAAGLVYWKVPQLVRPTAFCLLVKAVGTVLVLLASVFNIAVMGYASFPDMPTTGNSSAATMAVAATFVPP